MSGYDVKKLKLELARREKECRTVRAFLKAMQEYEDVCTTGGTRRAVSGGGRRPLKQRMLDQMQAEPGRVWSAKELAALVGADVQQVRNGFGVLEREGLVTKNMSGRYQLASASGNDPAELPAANQ